MNNKHVATIVIALLIVAIVQGSLSMRGIANTRQQEADKQSQLATAAQTQLARETLQFDEFKRSSTQLVDYLAKWQPYFSDLDSAQRAELNISLKIKENNLVGLSQRYEMVSLKGNASIPRALRAYLTFEDDYVRLLNWLGRIEQQLPTMRINSIQISKGTAANDLRMTIVLDQPLVQK